MKPYYFIHLYLSFVYRNVPTYKQKIAGKSPPTEKFAIRKARRYKAASPVRLPVPVLVKSPLHTHTHTHFGIRASLQWSLFCYRKWCTCGMVSAWSASDQSWLMEWCRRWKRQSAPCWRRPVLTDDASHVQKQITAEKHERVSSECARSHLSAENEYSVDDKCLILLLKGLCLKNQGCLQAAEECFHKVVSRWLPVQIHPHYECVSDGCVSGMGWRPVQCIFLTQPLEDDALMMKCWISSV